MNARSTSPSLGELARIAASRKRSTGEFPPRVAQEAVQSGLGFGSEPLEQRPLARIGYGQSFTSGATLQRPASSSTARPEQPLVPLAAFIDAVWLEVQAEIDAVRLDRGNFDTGQR